MMTMLDNIWLCLMEFLGFLDKGGERHTHCNALALNRMGSRLSPSGEAESWQPVYGHIVLVDIAGHKALILILLLGLGRKYLALPRYIYIELWIVIIFAQYIATPEDGHTG